MKKIQMPIVQNYYYLVSRTDSKINKEKIVLSYLTEKEEKDLDHGSIRIVRGDKTFLLTSNNVYCYGEVNLTKGSRDYRHIERLDLLSHLSYGGKIIPSDYDYETHTCLSPINRYRLSETWNGAVLVQYAHACLNKPKRIVLFYTTV